MTIEVEKFNPLSEVLKPGWEERYAELSPDDFDVQITYNKSKFDDDEIRRLDIKLEIIKEYAVSLAVGMSKGCYKYFSDERSPEEWATFEEDEQNDVTNYRLLRKSSERAIQQRLEGEGK